MTLRIELTPEAEAKLRDRARTSGLSPDEYARRLVEQAVITGQPNGAPTAGSLTPEEVSRRADALKAWHRGHRPGLGPVDDSRDSIYSGRGE